MSQTTDSGSESSGGAVNMPLMIRRLCEAYLGTTPADYEDLTLDQLYVMAIDKELLQDIGGGIRSMSVGSAQAKSLIPNQTQELGGHRSLAEKLWAEKHAKKRRK